MRKFVYSPALVENSNAQECTVGGVGIGRDYALSLSGARKKSPYGDNEQSMKVVGYETVVLSHGRPDKDSTLERSVLRNVSVRYAPNNEAIMDAAQKRTSDHYLKQAGGSRFDYERDLKMTLPRNMTGITRTEDADTGSAVRNLGYEVPTDRVVDAQQSQFNVPLRRAQDDPLTECRFTNACDVAVRSCNLYSNTAARVCSIPPSHSSAPVHIVDGGCVSEVDNAPDNGVFTQFQYPNPAVAGAFLDVGSFGQHAKDKALVMNGTNKWTPANDAGLMPEHGGTMPGPTLRNRIQHYGTVFIYQKVA
jgi:hypothetical protein